MYYEMRTYTVKLGQIKEYNKLFEEIGYPIISKYTTLVGWWHTEIGELNQLIHIWAYESLDERTKKRAELYQDPAWLNDFVPKAFPLLEKQESKLLIAAPFSPIK
ncbi:NIPSNAP family protein [Rhizobium sullae]|uniref:NIPSNAP family protein n=1 Tax=Rhizobium sullae TaxID=50338 RepID=A0A2N0D023_RHISU|nr:NIPSNAP family protein [Rhizobium sullae]PKA39474.1 NIPSNAP family protein [Rhizobium sullae]